MAAALAVAENPKHKVLLLERQQRVGRKLLSTGNGRCNLTNTESVPARYHGEDPSFTLYALEKYPPAEILRYFSSLGLLTRTEYGGRVYPLSNSANSVVDVLRFALEGAGVEIKTASPVCAVKKQKEGFLVETEEERIPADRVIVACGGCAGSKLGGVQDGYKLLQSLGHTRTKLFPSLVQMTVKDPRYPRALKGVKADARLTLEGDTKAEGTGEVLFTEKGVSGPAVFDLSRAVSTVPEGKIRLLLDFMREYTEEQVLHHLKDRAARLPNAAAGDLFVGTVHNRLGKMLIRYAGIDGNTLLKNLTEKQLQDAARAAKDFALEIKGTEGFDQAQVTAGGIRTSEFNPETMESRLVQGLYACGEVLDIDGDCGGFNLQWAWASGRLAGGAVK